MDSKEDRKAKLAQLKAERDKSREERQARTQAKNASRAEATDLLDELGIGEANLREPETLNIRPTLERLQSEPPLADELKKKIFMNLNRYIATRYKLPPEEQAQFVLDNLEDLFTLIGLDMDNVPMAKTVKSLTMQIIKQSESLNPNLVRDNLDTFFAMMERGQGGAVALLKDQYAKIPDDFHNSSRVSSVVRASMAGNTASSQVSLWLLSQICEARPDLVAPYTHTFANKLSGVSATMTLQCLRSIAQYDSSKVHPMLPDVVLAVSTNNSLQFILAKLLGACARNPPKSAANASTENVALTLLLCMVDPTLESGSLQPPGFSRPVQFANLTDVGARTVFVELKTLIASAVLARERFAAFVPPVEEYISRGGDVGSSAQALITEYKGLSIESVGARLDVLEEKIQNLNDKVADVCYSFEDVKRYVDENIADVKDFVADVVKKLPAPTQLTVIGSTRKTLLLHYECCRHNPGCMYPQSRAFTTETKEWSKWIKMGFSLAKLGKTAIHIGAGNPLGVLKTGIDCLSEVYAAYKENDDEDFDKFISKPFLQSADQDKLISQLEDAGFFKTFEYAAQQGGWSCSMCKHSGGRLNDTKTVEANTAEFAAATTSTETPKFQRMEGPGKIPWSNKETLKAKTAEANDQQKRQSAREITIGATPRDQRKSLKYGVVWQPDKEATHCNACNTAFGVIKRRHHCRVCGMIFCDSCCGARIKTAGSDNRKRACLSCVKALREGDVVPTSAQSAGDISDDSKENDTNKYADDVWMLAEDDSFFVFTDKSKAKQRTKISLNAVRTIGSEPSGPSLKVTTQTQELTINVDSTDTQDKWLGVLRHNLGLMSAHSMTTLQRKDDSALAVGKALVGDVANVLGIRDQVVAKVEGTANAEIAARI